MPWTKESASVELGELLTAIDVLKSEKRYGAEHARWLLRTQRFLGQVFGLKSTFYGSFSRLSWTYSGPVEELSQTVIDRAHQGAYVERLETARGFLLAARDELARSTLDEVFSGKDTGPEASLILKVINIAEQKLRMAVREVPTRERQVQDAFETLLVGADVPYSREIGGIEYSSKTYTPDFVIAQADLVVELKLCKEGREKDLIAEINDDILAYGTKYGNMLFVVYDLGQIRDVERFASSFKTDKVLVRVVKH